MNKELWLNWPISVEWSGWKNRCFWSWFTSHGIQVGWKDIGEGVFSWVYHVGPLRIIFGSKDAKVISVVEHELYSKKITDYYAEQVNRAREDWRKDRERLIGSHQACHKTMGDFVAWQQDQMAMVDGLLEKFAEEIRASGRTVEADRLLDIAHLLTFALEQKVKRHYDLGGGRDVREDQKFLH